MARTHLDRDIRNRDGHSLTRTRGRAGQFDDSPPVPMCAPCAEKGPRKRRPGEPTVTYVVAEMAGEDMDALSAAFLHRCFRCCDPDKSLSAYVVRCTW